MRVVHHALQKVSATMLVAGGAGIAIVPATLAGIHADALQIVSIEGRHPTASIAIAARIDEQGVLPKRFRQFCLDRCNSDSASKRA